MSEKIIWFVVGGLWLVDDWRWLIGAEKEINMYNNLYIYL
jgi:hypothetical protein